MKGDRVMNEVEPEDKDSVFAHGSVWLRADFHLHTKADKEFTLPNKDNGFVAAYVNGLEKANIRIGVIANHNKFDYILLSDPPSSAS